MPASTKPLSNRERDDRINLDKVAELRAAGETICWIAISTTEARQLLDGDVSPSIRRQASRSIEE